MLLFTHHLFLLIGFLLAFVLFSRLLVERRSPASTLAWLLVIFLVPYVGIPLYLALGGRKLRRMMDTKDALYDESEADAAQLSQHVAEGILISSGVPPARRGNRATLLPTGEETYRKLGELLREARTSIEVVTFILGRDEVGDALLDTLAARAAAGLEVRLLLDAIGCFHFDRKKLERLRERGGRTAFFMPMLHVPFRGYSNLRNHRKLVVVDGKTAIVGGMNLAREYMGPTPLASRWKDLSLLVEGPAVRDVAEVFRSDWCFATKEKLPPPPLPSEQGSAQVQVVGSGPDAEGDPLYDAYLTELFRAEKRIWVASPYFVPDDALVRGFTLAARRGVDVRILVPRQSNHAAADLARGPSLREIEKAGGKVLLFDGGMMHAKATLFDEDCAVVASANLDMRSLFLNYEIAVFLYSKSEVDSLVRWFEMLATHAPAGLSAVGHTRELFEGMARLVSPLL